MKAYITKSNSKSIVYKLDFDSIDLNEEVYHVDFKWFSKYEIKGLLAFKMLFKSPEQFFKKYKPKKTLDTKQYVFEGQAPAHHIDPNCERILSSFHNYKIPEEVKEKGEESVEEFRSWFKENSYLLEDKMDFFLDKLRWKFGLSERPEAIDYKNSGVDLIENLNLEELESRIETKIRESNKFYQSTSKNKVILDNFGQYSFLYKEKKDPYGNNTNYSKEEIWAVLEEFDVEYKTPLTLLLREYYRVKYNPELEFEGSLLEQLGFAPCRSCHFIEDLDTFDNASNSLIPDYQEFVPTSYSNSKEISNQATIILFENDYFSVATDYDRLNQLIEKQLLKYPGSCYRDVQPLINKEYQSSAFINAVTLCQQKRIGPHDLESLLMDLLEEGSCRVYNVKKRAYEKSVEIVEWESHLEEMIGAGGRTCLIDGEVLLSIEDWTC